MSFTSFEFLAFFVLVAAFRQISRSRVSEIWLFVISSLIFYLTWNVPCILLVLLTGFVDFSVSRRLVQTSEPSRRRNFLLLSLAFNLGMLGLFKYANFFLSSLSGLSALFGAKLFEGRYNIYLPPAISFFTFSSLSYVIDVYYERIPPADKLRDYVCYLTFFPKLMSGPIVRAGEFLPQLASRAATSWEDLEVGVAHVILGSLKKLAIADQIGPHVSSIFSAPDQFDRVTLILGALGYTVQIFCDFSGYSDIAIGCGRILGFRFPENFQMPYSSRNIAEFWRRWHISLSRWFRDYLFLPLEMAFRSNPNPTLRVSLNMMITMLLCGLWHGPSWTFVAWGGLHGAALVAQRIWTAKGPNTARWAPLPKGVAVAASHCLTVGFVVVSMVLFRAETLSSAGTYLSRMLLGTHGGTRVLSPYIVVAVAVVFLLHLAVNKDRNFAEDLPKMSFVPRLASYATLLLLLVVFAATDSSSFIYFQF